MLIVSMATRQDDQVGAKQAEERGRYSYSQLVIICRVGLEGVRSSGVLLPGHVLLTQGGGKDCLDSLSLSERATLGRIPAVTGGDDQVPRLSSKVRHVTSPDPRLVVWWH